MIGLLWVAVALAAPVGEPESVVQPLSAGARIDWTNQRLEAEAKGRIAGVDATQRIVEQDLRVELGPILLEGAREVLVQHELTVGDVIAQADDLGRQMGSAVGWWEVFEAHYTSSGRVSLVGGIPLTDLARPWALSVAVQRPADEWIQEFELTGLLVDARGTGAIPAYAPRVLTADGGELFDGVLWQDVATSVVPALYVTDPADPAALRIGAKPLVVRATGAIGPDVVLSAADAERFRAQRLGSLLRRGALVIVVDRP